MKKLICLLLCLAMVLSLTACAQDTPTETTQAPTETTQPEPTAQELYAAAVAQVEALESLTLDITLRRKMILGVDTYTQNITQTLTIQDTDGGLTARLEEESYIGSYFSETTETFLDGTVYSEMAQVGSYQAPMEQEEYLSRFVPAVLLEGGLYTLEAHTEKSLVFTDPTAAESWLGEDAVLLTASGTAELSEELGLKRSTYEVSYLLGGVEFQDSFAVTLSQGPAEAITAPEGEFEKLDSIYGPRLLDEALGWLYQVESYSSSVSDTTVSQAGGTVWTEITSSHGYRADEGYICDLTTDITTVNLSIDVTEQATYHESYADGVYSIENTDGTTAAEESTEDTALYINRNVVCQNMLSPLDVETFELLDLGSTLMLKCTMTEKTGEYNGLLAADMIYTDPNILNDSASDYRTDKADYYIGFDRITGLPTALGLDYQGTHIIDGIPYTLTRNVTQSITYGHPSTYEAITGEKLELKTDAPDPTPLLYKVTGQNGETMYLFGTIHVGDSRTANLPQYLLDAFAACDALAVEFDSDAFTEQLDSDPELLQQYMKAMLYTDGTTTDDHIEDKELFEMAQELLKATGLYEQTMILYKPYIWSQTIDNYNLDWSFDITSDYGLESRLQAMANDQGKEIRDVESGIEQLQMLTGFSDALQEQLLAESLYTSRAEYISGVRELFELWCTGDEAALTAYINEEPEVDESQLTEEEKLEYQEYLKLYEEYEKAVSADRNAGMLEVAKEYLSSGDTVFYAVGLAHLLAEDGLVNTLRQAGYTVEVVN